ncbi:MAG: hypothetical protein KKG99_17410 [Bacteroidetes bacterium]|nr:hypothetical protein [Bacteroidota bacterium]
MVDVTWRPARGNEIKHVKSFIRVLRRYGVKQSRVFLAVGKRDAEGEPIDPDLGLNVIGVATCVIHHL